jgi:tetratricopeptide (TPR) repeat protein
MTEALERNPIDEKTRFRRAQLLSRLGQSEEAVREFRLIAELNPHHVDAQRELRLWEIRNRGDRKRSGEFGRAVSNHPSDHPPSPGLFGRLFKK